MTQDNKRHQSVSVVDSRGEAMLGPVRIKNSGEYWPAGETRPVQLSYGEDGQPEWVSK